MLTALQSALDCKALYDGDRIFDYAARINEVSFAIKHYPDCEEIVCEGSFNIPDWWSNFKAIMVRVPNIGGVEFGFWTGIMDTATDISNRIDKTKPVRLTGHSRGAAHARMLAVVMHGMGYDVNLLTFESPHAGDHAFESLVDKFPNVTYRNYQAFDAQDFVCTVPFFDPWSGCKYQSPRSEIIFNEPPAPNDPWFVLARHHIDLNVKFLS